MPSTTTFPGSLDATFPPKASLVGHPLSDILGNATDAHSDWMSRVGGAINAVEAAVGVTSSGVTSSLRYIVEHLRTTSLLDWETTPPGNSDVPIYNSTTGLIEWGPQTGGSGTVTGGGVPVGHKTFTADTGGGGTTTMYDAAVGGLNAITGPGSPTVAINSTTIRENSGLGMSQVHTQGGKPLMYGHNDSGDSYASNPTQGSGYRARFYAIDASTGLRLRDYRMRAPSAGAYKANIDFEDMCYVTKSSVHYIFLYDSNNTSSGSSPPAGISKLYRCVEPANTGTDQDIDAIELTVNWNGGGANTHGSGPNYGYYVEAMCVDPLNGHLILASTSVSGNTRFFESTTDVTAAADGATVLLTQIASLTTFAAVSPNTGTDWVAGIDIAPDRSVFGVKMYNGSGTHYDRVFLYEFAVPASTTMTTLLGTTGRLATTDGAGHDVWNEIQGEAFAFGPDSVSYWRLSEGTSRTIGKFGFAPAGGGADEYDITVADLDYIILANCTAGFSGTIHLPAPASGPKRVWVKRTDDLFDENLALIPDSGDLNGSTDAYYIGNGETVYVYNTGTAYETIGGGG